MMHTVNRTASDRLDINVRGKMDAAEAESMIHELFLQSTGIENGRMLIDVDEFEMPTAGAFREELSRLPDLFRFSQQFRRAAVLADEGWVRAMSSLEGKLLPGLAIKSFSRDQRNEAEAWLAQAHKDELVGQ